MLQITHSAQAEPGPAGPVGVAPGPGRPRAELVPDTDVLIVDGVVCAVGVGLVGPPGVATEDCSGRVVAPGFIDLHVHAVGGAWVTGPDPTSLRRLGAALLARGVTGYLATSVSAPLPALVDLLSAARAVGAAPTRPEAACLGVHLEGPWLSPARAGAQPAQHLAAPAAADFRRLAASGPVAMVTLAPELDGANELMVAVLETGAVVALGHSDATYDQALAAFDAGARHVTHGFNAMRGLHHREPGLAGAALDAGAARLVDAGAPGRAPITVEAIADGVHLHPAILRLIHRAVGPDRMCLVSDCVDGDPADLGRSGEPEVLVTAGPAGAARRRVDGRLAGSTIGLDTCVRVCVDAGIPVAEALQMASTTPAAVLGRPDLGRLDPGAAGDVVVLGPALEVVLVVRDGVVVHRAEESG